MAFSIPALDTLIHELTGLPGIGEKTAQRLAFFILKSGKDYSERLRMALDAVQLQVHYCPQCFAFTDQELCRICSSVDRNKTQVCVVEEASDVIRIEAAGTFKGLYHVLQGTISPLDGVAPSDLRIHELVERIHDSQLDPVNPIREVILALDADLEGDTTSLYLARLLHPKNIKLTRIAHGVPFGSDIDYIDQRTLGRAMENRVEL